MRFVDLAGRTFGRWTVISYVGNKHWLCRCSCSREKEVLSDNLKSGRSRSCGCLSVEVSRAAFTKHGNAKGRNVTPEYRAWQGMKYRCLNKTCAAYSNYGGRGIEIHEAWEDDFRAFYEHIGPRPGRGYSLDRIDVDGGYVPGNVRWATDVVQARNRRIVGVVGNVDTVTARLMNGVSRTTYHRRIRQGWGREDAATIPPRAKRARKPPTPPEPLS